MCCFGRVALRGRRSVRAPAGAPWRSHPGRPSCRRRRTRLPCCRPVVLAVVDDHAHVLQRIAGDRAAGEHLAHAFFHRGHELAGNGAALDLVDELEAAAARHRFDAQEHFAELAGAAGLLLVAVVAFGLGADGFAIGDARRVGLHLDAVALLAGASSWIRRWRSREPRITSRWFPPVFYPKQGSSSAEFVQRGGEFLFLALAVEIRPAGQEGGLLGGGQGLAGLEPRHLRAGLGIGGGGSGFVPPLRSPSRIGGILLMSSPLFSCDLKTEFRLGGARPGPLRAGGR